MMKQQKITSYGVRPVESLAGMAPGPVPRMDPPSATGQTNLKSNRKAKVVSNNLKGKPRNYKLPKYQSLNILQFNLDGISTKKTELAYFLDKNDIHVALLQETQKGRQTDLHITNYTPKHCDCPQCQGTVTYIRNDVTGRTENRPENSTCIQKTLLWYSGVRYQIYNVYHPPGSTLNLQNSFNETVYKNAIIAGDFNSHSPTWGYKDLDGNGKVIEDLVGSTNLFLTQDNQSSPTLLHKAYQTLHRPDLTILSSDLLNKNSTEVSDDIGKSDHRPIIIQIFSTGKKTFKQRTRWNFKNAPWDLYKIASNELLQKIDMTSQNVDKISEEITSAILKAATQTIPRGCRKKYKPFWNKTLEAAVQSKEKSRKKFEKNPTTFNKCAYNRASAKVRKLTNSSKREKFQKTCNDLDLHREGHKAWALVHNLSGEKRISNPKPLKTIEGEIAEDQKKANAHNKYFASVNKASKPTEEHKVLLKSLKAREKAPNASIKYFEDDLTMNELHSALRKLKSRKTPGPDNLHNEMIKNLGTEGKKVILNFINITWKQGQLPSIWKTATIVPVLKKDKCPEELSSYRPISLTSCLGKVAEKIINTRLYWWLEASKLLNVHQAGFRTGHRTEDQLFTLTQKVIDGFHEKEHTAAVFVDLKQAYDRVWRKGLLLKMKRIGIHGHLYSWIKNFLSNRLIQTRVNHSTSSKHVLEEGLPQGSSLSCTLFLIFINDLPEELHSEKTLFADDLTIWNTDKQIETSVSQLNADLSRLVNYCSKWKLTINTSKTVYTVFSNSPKLPIKNSF